MFVFDPGRKLTKKEINKIRHTITPIEKIRGILKTKESCIEAPYEGKKVRRNETVDK